MNIRDDDKVEGLRMKAQCTRGNQKDVYACRIDQYKTNNRLNRVEYVASSAALKKGIELDFVVSVDTPSIQKSIDRIINSIKPMPGKQNDDTCLGLAEWM